MDTSNWNITKKGNIWYNIFLTIVILIFAIVIIKGLLNIGLHISKARSNIIKYGTVYHRSCAGKLLDTYKGCKNIREEGNLLIWEIDQTNDITGYSILKSGIIKVEIKEE